jgi:hypothetical protein
MSELQLGLLAIGALLVAGVLAYNRYQEKAAQRTAERKFRSAHADVLLEPQTPRREPTLPAQKPPAAAPVRAEADAGALPDPSIDYVIDLSFEAPQQSSVLAEQWKPNEHRYAGQALLASSGGGGSWRRLHAGDPLPVESLRAGLQLVTRSRIANDAQLIEFRAAVETLAGATGASIRAAEIRQATETARELERFCDDADLQVVIHVAPGDGGLLSEQVRAAATRAGFAAGEDGRFTLRDGDGNLLYALEPADAAAGVSGVSLTLEVPRVADFPRVFRSMAGFAAELAREAGGTLVDDNRNALDERALQAIAAQLDAVRAQFDARGIVPGSPSALRLFS